MNKMNRASREYSKQQTVRTVQTHRPTAMPHEKQKAEEEEKK